MREPDVGKLCQLMSLLGAQQDQEQLNNGQPILRVFAPKLTNVHNGHILPALANKDDAAW